MSCLNRVSSEYLCTYKRFDLILCEDIWYNVYPINEKLFGWQKYSNKI